MEVGGWVSAGPSTRAEPTFDRVCGFFDREKLDSAPRCSAGGKLSVEGRMFIGRGQAIATKVCVAPHRSSKLERLRPLPAGRWQIASCGFGNGGGVELISASLLIIKEQNHS